MPTAYELEREANIARNRALLDQLALKDAVAQLGIPAAKPTAKSKAKPVQSAKRASTKRARSEVDNEPRRQSARLRRPAAPDPDETPAKRRRREKEEEERKAKEAEERLLAEEEARHARLPRHHDLDLATLADDPAVEELDGLRAALKATVDEARSRRAAECEAFVFNDDEREEAEVAELRQRMSKLRVVARAKVTQDRVYSAAYHPDPAKDLIFFGDKHGQLGIWDARAAPDEVADDDDDEGSSADAREGGKYWRLQMHWPATSKSSISSIKLDPVDAHSLYTSAYDCTIRHLSFSTGISREVYAAPEGTLISAVDLAPDGRTLWAADAAGALTHLDVRQDARTGGATSYGLSLQKIGAVSVNPTAPHLLLTASNDRTLKIWDVRKLASIGGGAPEPAATLLTPPPSSPVGSRDATPASIASTVREYDAEAVEAFLESKAGRGARRGEWRHGKSVSAAHWDPRGRSVVSTSYDDVLRLWDFTPKSLATADPLKSMRPFAQIKHNCQTGKWLTILKAQWTPNPDVYPHFTIGNMDHSLDIFSCKGDVIARLSDRQKITAVQAVTASHPSVVERAVSGNASGRCVLWAPPEEN